MGARSRRKGHAYERYVAGRLTEASGVLHKRVLDESREGNARGDLESDLPVTYQVKVGARPNPWNALREAMEACPGHHHPVAIMRMNGAGSRPPTDMVAMPLEDWLEVLHLLTTFGLWR